MVEEIRKANDKIANLIAMPTESPKINQAAQKSVPAKQSAVQSQRVRNAPGKDNSPLTAQVNQLSRQA